MRGKICFLLFILISTISYCQIPNFEHNYTRKDTLENPLMVTFLKQYEFVFIYRTLSWGDTNCKIIGLKNGNWKCWEYSNNVIQWTKRKGESEVILDTIKNGTFLGGENGKKIKKKDVQKLLAELNENKFWNLENDSLNQSRVVETYIENGDTIRRKAIISDGTKYIFDIITENKSRIIQSYYPEFFVKLFPDMIDRKKFIENKDYFLDWWKKYCY